MPYNVSHSCGSRCDYYGFPVFPITVSISDNRQSLCMPFHCIFLYKYGQFSKHTGCILAKWGDMAWILYSNLQYNMISFIIVLYCTVHRIHAISPHFAKMHPVCFKIHSVIGQKWLVWSLLLKHYLVVFCFCQMQTRIIPNVTVLRWPSSVTETRDRCLVRMETCRSRSSLSRWNAAKLFMANRSCSLFRCVSVCTEPLAVAISPYGWLMTHYGWLAG